jgi:dienelactone hydrolase
VRLLRLLAVGVALAGLTIVTRPYLRGLSFVIRAADVQGTLRRLADVDAAAVHERELAIPTADGSMRGRVYEPEGRSTQTTLLVGGFHSSGFDEPGLIRVARLLASNRITVVTPDIPELARFDLTPALTDAIERVAVWLADDSGLAPTRRIGIFGISFSGGLSIVAAGRPALANRVSHILAVGAHDDLLRVLKFLCTGQEPFPPGQARIALNAAGAGSLADAGRPFTRTPEGDGLALILRGVAARVVPGAQVESLRDSVGQYLQASPPDLDALKGRFDKAPEPSRTLLRYVAARDTVHLGARLLPYINGYASAAALSPAKSPKPGAPVFLLHGVDDNLIPSVESEYLAEGLRTHVPVRLLLSGAVPRDAGRPLKVGDALQLAGFWADVLSR